MGRPGSTRPTRTSRRLGGLLVPAPKELLTMHPVSTDVNKVSSKGAELIEAVGADAALTKRRSSLGSSR